MTSFKISSAVKMDKGRVRSNNEDNFYFNGKFLSPKERDNTTEYSHTLSGNSNVALYGIFDGMGGEEFGEEASLIAAQETKVFGKRISKDGSNLRASVLKAIQSANDKICQKITDCGGKRIGATYSLLGISGDKAEVFNIGDSRVYMLRDGKLKQISVDDTSAQRMVNMGFITAEQAKTHNDRHKLTQHLGIFHDEMIIEPHISEKITLKYGDVFLLCSDGLTDMVDDASIESILNTYKTGAAAVEELVKTALENGGKDNVTVTVVCIEKDSSAGGSKKGMVFGIAALVIVLAAGLSLRYGFVGNLNGTGYSKVQGKLPESMAAAQHEVQEIKVPKDTLELKVKEKHSLSYEVVPTEAKAAVNIESKNEKIATVDAEGVITAVSPGETQIVFTSDGYEKSITVIVKSDTNERNTKNTVVENQKTVKKDETPKIDEKKDPVTRSGSDGNPEPEENLGDEDTEGSASEETQPTGGDGQESDQTGSGGDSANPEGNGNGENNGTALE